MANKKHVVMARDTRVAQEGVQTSQGTLKFNEHGSAYVDADIANEIEHTQGLKGTGEVWTHEDPVGNWMTTYKADGVHSYFFGVPSKAYEKGWEHIFGKKRENAATSVAEAQDGEKENI